MYVFIIFKAKRLSIGCLSMVFLRFLGTVQALGQGVGRIWGYFNDGDQKTPAEVGAIWWHLI
jgi:hypothetical protein